MPDEEIFDKENMDESAEEMALRINGKFIPGLSGNPMGRPIGSHKTIDNEMRKILKKNITEWGKNLSEDLKTMKPTERWRVIESLMKYSLPTYAAIKNETEEDFENKEIKIVFETREKPKN